jgi:hypothetical protein
VQPVELVRFLGGTALAALVLAVASFSGVRRIPLSTAKSNARTRRAHPCRCSGGSRHSHHYSSAVASIRALASFCGELQNKLLLGSITYTPRPGRHSSVVEQLFRKQQVLGSSPSVGSTPLVRPRVAPLTGHRDRNGPATTLIALLICTPRYAQSAARCARCVPRSFSHSTRWQVAGRLPRRDRLVPPVARILSESSCVSQRPSPSRAAPD